MKKKLWFIIGFIIAILAIIAAFIIYQKTNYYKDIVIMKSKIESVNNYLLKKDGNFETIKDELKKESVSNKRVEVEKELNLYLNNIIDEIHELNTITDNSNVFDKEKLKENIDNIIKEQKNNKDALDKIKDKLISLKEIDDSKIVDLHNKEIFNELLMDNIKVDEYEQTIDEFNEIIDGNIKKLDYLKKNNGTWKFDNKKIIFTKRSNYNEYKKISVDDNYELIKDNTGPVITASDISITKGTKINVKDKVKCVDAVDGKVECKIDGEYDTNKAGKYSIKVTAIDESKNTSSKSIKLTVKEKVNNSKPTAVSGKPYYIEVIRNQNVVIVYGLDSNNKYTKIVKVFICSTGKSTSKTPTGTFKTSDKAKWGWLVGNLYGQYYTRITGSILFHSVPYTKKAKNTLEWDEYNKLGTAASKGCVRMTVKDVKWIYDNCPRGTTVKIYDGSLPSGVTKPTAKKISADSPNKGWDPTDPDKNNPWKK